MPLSYSEAKALAEARIRSYGDLGVGELMIIEKYVRERVYGWVFPWAAVRFVRERDFRAAIPGNSPLLVLKSTGEVIPLSTASTVEEALLSFEKERPEVLTELE